MKKILFLVFFISFLLFGENIIIKTSQGFDKERNLVIDNRNLEMENLKIGYTAHHEKDKKENVVQKYGDFFLGCDFGRKGNGGWDVWHFITVLVNIDGKVFDGISKYLLEDILILEDGERKMVEFTWPLDEMGEKKLYMRIVKFNDIKEWFFMKVWFEGDNVSFVHIGLSNYPANTSGPPERERWIAAKSGTYNMHQGEASLEKEDYSIIFYNKNAQEQDGCLLVYIPEEIEKVRVAGTYGVGATFFPVKNNKSIEFALGYFFDTFYQEKINSFIGKEDTEIYKKLKDINWEPNFDFSQLERSFEQISKYKDIIENYEELKKEKEQVEREKNVIEAIKIIRKFGEIKNKAIEEKLKEYI